MKALRKRPRPDALANEKRRVTNATGRMIYLVLLMGFGLAGANYLAGDFVFFKADGLVVRDKSVVAAIYVARVGEVRAREAQLVEEGDILFQLQSTEMLERLADLSTRRAQLAAKAAEFKVKSETISQLLPLANKIEMETGKTVVKFDKLRLNGLATSAGYDNALKASYDAQLDRVRMATQKRVFENELASLTAAQSDADAAIADLKQHYSGGIVRASTSGVVGTSVPSVGDVFGAGQPIMSIYSGEVYVLAYLPRRYLFPVDVGQQVNVSDGRNDVTGTIAEILPLTGALPMEFQNTFKPRDRNQLAKIRFSSPPSFPLHEKVTLSVSLFGPTGMVEQASDALRPTFGPMQFVKNEILGQ